MSNLSAPPFKYYDPAGTPGSEVVAAGAAGWVDTDVSAITGTDTGKFWLIGVFAAAAQSVGARPHGSSNASTVWCSNSLTLICRPDSNGHMDLYRGAGGDNTYNFIGYFK